MSASTRQSRERDIRVCLIGPSPEKVGGQAVVARQLMDNVAALPGVEMGFLPIDARFPGPLRALQVVIYVRTLLGMIFYVG